MQSLIVPNVLQQHADDAAAIATSRKALVLAPYAKLQRLLAADRRLAAHLDGLRLAGAHASSLCEAMLENPSAGVVFVLAVSALEAKDTARFDQLMAVAQAVPDGRDGLLEAIGWVDGPRLQGVVSSLLRNPDGFSRMVGVAACAIHRVDPGLGSGSYVKDQDPPVRARSLQAAGELGLSDLVTACSDASRDDTDPEAKFWAAWSGALLGDRKIAVDELTRVGLSSGPHRTQAFRLAIQAMSRTAAHRILQDLATDPRQTRWVIQGSGIAGDPTYAPWLIKRMTELDTARLAAAAFTLITGVDLGAQALDRPAPENFESGPNDDPDDPNVDMDPDEGLPWPDVKKIEAWWHTNQGHFQKGTRYFMGAPVTKEHCIHVLKTGYQRQRILAAQYLCLLEPGTPLFNTSAPAWRQQRLLAAM